MTLFIDFSTDFIEKRESFNKIESDYFDKVINFVNDLDQKDFFEVKSSGTTGVSKTITFSILKAIESAKISNNFFGVDNNFIFVNPINIDFVGSKMLVLRAKIAKAKIIFTFPKKNISEFKDSQNIFDFISITDIQLQNSINANSNFPIYFKKILIGGSSVQNSTLELINNKKYFNTIFYESYGCSESLSHIAIKNLSINEPFFKLLDGYNIQKDKRNCLKIEHKSIFLNPIQTNDIVNIIDENHFEIIGRIDNVINSGGIKFIPEDIEKKLKYLKFEFYISSMKDNEFGQICVIVVKNDVFYSNVEIINMCRIILKNSKETPKRVVRTKEFIYNDNNKLCRVVF